MISILGQIRTAIVNWFDGAFAADGMRAGGGEFWSFDALVEPEDRLKERERTTEREPATEQFEPLHWSSHTHF
ncbi:hypothetical protein AB6806_26685 [Bosea sp. RCC_152_1]|uniref:hypothetical protein n=1 Tax=Bosea sp. RCC_152_1 TaxID=3239228 RepID=UPI0035250FD8